MIPGGPLRLLQVLPFSRIPLLLRPKPVGPDGGGEEEEAGGRGRGGGGGCSGGRSVLGGGGDGRGGRRGERRYGGRVKIGYLTG